jgi:hypothetical protein
MATEHDIGLVRLERTCCGARKGAVDESTTSELLRFRHGCIYKYDDANAKTVSSAEGRRMAGTMRAAQAGFVDSLIDCF